MTYPLNAPLTELLLLSIISESDSYGYIISQNLRKVSKLNDSALYPMLKKLSDQGYVEIYDQQFQGRNRKYYRITNTGDTRRLELKKEWDEYCAQIKDIVEFEVKDAASEGGNENDQK